MHQVEIVYLEDLVSPNHPYRRFLELWDFKEVESSFKQVKSQNPHEGYGIGRIFRCLIIQFMEDLSDRELSEFR